MSDCLNCNKELLHVEGRRKKKFCNNSCRVTYWQKTHAKSHDKQKSFSEHIAAESSVPSWKAAYDEYMKKQKTKT